MKSSRLFRVQGSFFARLSNMAIVERHWESSFGTIFSMASGYPK